MPIVIKANTSVKGLVTSAGWNGYLIPGHELIAPADATVVAKLKAAGRDHPRADEHAGFRGERHEHQQRVRPHRQRLRLALQPRRVVGRNGDRGGRELLRARNGTDTGNSIRMPAATSALVGVFPTRGLVSIAGIAPLDWLLDNTGPIARNVTDVAIALDVMAGEDPKDVRTKGSAIQAQPGPYTKYLNADALKGKRFGVPAFIVNAAGASNDGTSLQPETREMFMKAVEGLRAAGATVVFDDAILSSSFMGLIGAINTQPYVGEGTETFLRDFGPAEYHSSAEYAQAVGSPLPSFVRGVGAGSQARQGRWRAILWPRQISGCHSGRPLPRMMQRWISSSSTALSIRRCRCHRTTSCFPCWRVVEAMAHTAKPRG